MDLGSLLGMGLGAGAGALVGGPMGAGVGASIGGGLGTILGNSGAGDFQSPSFSDINLATENPELYQQIMQLDSVANQAEQQYQQRAQGPTAYENNELNQSRVTSQNQLASQGLLGTSAGVSAEEGTQQQVQAQIAQRAAAQQNADLQQALASRQAVVNATAQGQQQVFNPMMTGAQMNYQNALNQSQAQNQFGSGLINGGIALGANAYNNAQLASTNQANQYMMANGGYGVGGYNPMQPVSQQFAPPMSQNYYGSPTPSGNAANSALGMNYSFGGP